MDVQEHGYFYSRQWFLISAMGISILRRQTRLQCEIMAEIQLQFYDRLFL